MTDDAILSPLPFLQTDSLSVFILLIVYEGDDGAGSTPLPLWPAHWLGIGLGFGISTRRRAPPHRIDQNQSDIGKHHTMTVQVGMFLPYADGLFLRGNIFNMTNRPENIGDRSAQTKQ